MPLPEKWRTIDEADEGHLEGVDRCRQLCFKLVKVLNQLGGRCLCNSVDCQELKNARCEGCELRWCCRCAHEAGECIVCEQAWARQHKSNGTAHSESKNCKKIRKRTAPTTSVTNMHELGRNFVEEVLDVRESKASTEEEAAKGHRLLSSSVKSEDGRRRHALKYVLFCWASQMRGYVNIWCVSTEAFCFTSQPTCGQL